jgi:hypothetical protein
MIKRVIRVVGEVFEVMTQVDLGLTNVSRFDSNAYAMQCILKTDFYFNSKRCEEDQKNKFRIERSV